MKVCITGLIGSGKSSVLNILKKYTNNIYSCDNINDQLLTDKSYLDLLQENFGNEIIIDGKIDKKSLARIIFQDAKKRQLLNSLSHPLIIKRLIEIIKNAEGDIYIEIPLLAESNLAISFDKIWLVESEFDFRLERIMKRDNISKELALAKINSQEKYQPILKSIATDIIYNNGELAFLEAQIKKLLDNIYE
jgi:dephospho-CoA kinase